MDNPGDSFCHNSAPGHYVHSTFAEHIRNHPIRSLGVALHPQFHPHHVPGRRTAQICGPPKKLRSETKTVKQKQKIHDKSYKIVLPYILGKLKEDNI